MFCLIFVLRRIVPVKVVLVLMSIAVLVWGIGVFTFASTRMVDPASPVFVGRGSSWSRRRSCCSRRQDRVWAKVADLLYASGRGLSARLGLAYPLAPEVPYEPPAAMYSIVIFTMTFISVLSGIFGNQVPVHRQRAIQLRPLRRLEPGQPRHDRPAESGPRGGVRRAADPRHRQRGDPEAHRRGERSDHRLRPVVARSGPTQARVAATRRCVGCQRPTEPCSTTRRSSS